MNRRSPNERLSEERVVLGQEQVYREVFQEDHGVSSTHKLECQSIISYSWKLASIPAAIQLLSSSRSDF